jgi:integrase/predicted RNA-binding Zn-ribbon protein involved in translation (DUF1610 family)
MGTAEESGREKPYSIEDNGVGSWANPQPPKSRPESPEKGLKCPECGSERLYRDGLRRLADGSQTQRWLCRDCGFRFSERRLNNGGKDLKSGSALNLNCRVGASESGAKNSAGTVRVLMEEKAADAEKRAAGATERLNEDDKEEAAPKVFIAKILEYGVWLLKQGYAQSTIEGRVKLLKRLVKIGANLFDPESVKEAISRQIWSDGRKELAVEAYSNFLKMCGGRWDPPKYKRQESLPFIPSEDEINQLIAGCSKRVAAFLQLLKETGARSGEAWRLKWSDIDQATRTVRIHPEKGSKPRILPISQNLLDMLNSLPMEKGERVFSKPQEHLKHFANLFRRQRNRLARKIKNPRLTRITFHTLRHWKATMEYHKTRDIIHVMQILGHKNIKNTLVYVQLEEALFRDVKEYISKTAKTVGEACFLIEAGFEYVCDMDGVKIFRKPKY